MVMNTKMKCICYFVALTAILSGCNDNFISSIPNYPVNLNLNLTSTYPTFKNNPGQFLILKTPPTAGERVGFGGILIYTSFDQDEPYYAFDLACPNEAEQNIKVVPNDLGQVVCEKCGTVYDIFTGTGLSANDPSKERLKKYKTSLQGDWLYIFN